MGFCTAPGLGDLRQQLPVFIGQCRLGANFTQFIAHGIDDQRVQAAQDDVAQRGRSTALRCAGFGQISASIRRTISAMV